MIYIVNDSNFYNRREHYSFDIFFFDLYNKLSQLDDVLIAYNNYFKVLNKTKRIRRKFGFKNPRDFDIKKCKENVVLHRNIMSYNDDCELLFDIFDYVDIHDKVMVLFTNDENYYSLNKKIHEYISEEKINYKFYNINSYLDKENESNALIRSLVRDLKLSKILL
jgi:hypothetical protein